MAHNPGLRPMQFVGLTIFGTIAADDLRSFIASILARFVSSDSAAKYVELVPTWTLFTMSAVASAAVMIALWQWESEEE